MTSRGTVVAKEREYPVADIAPVIKNEARWRRLWFIRGTLVMEVDPDVDTETVTRFIELGSDAGFDRFVFAVADEATQASLASSD